jgi:hypothetical protein
MGARGYIPSLGRFLTPDPVPEGSANPYDYAFQDHPINNFDLDGPCGHRGDKVNALGKSGPDGHHVPAPSADFSPEIPEERGPHR